MLNSYEMELYSVLHTWLPPEQAPCEVKIEGGVTHIGKTIYPPLRYAAILKVFAYSPSSSNDVHLRPK
jgi:hypothetical protein